MNLQDNIARMEQELADMKKQLEQQDKLELKGGNHLISTSCSPTYIPRPNMSAIHRGAFRATKELAEIADKNMVIRNRLEAYAMQVEPEWKGIVGWCIQELGSIYTVQMHSSRILGAIYMQKETAEILCKALNASEIEL